MHRRLDLACHSHYLLKALLCRAGIRCCILVHHTACRSELEFGQFIVVVLCLRPRQDLNSSPMESSGEVPGLVH